MSQVLGTAVGPATVLHRLALAVECRDALSDRPVADAPLVALVRRVPTVTNADPVWRRLAGRGGGRFTLPHPLASTRALPDLEVVVDDPTRRYVPRRFTVRPWQLAEVSEPAPYVAARSRLLRVWLLPGSAYPFPGATMLVRGRVEQGGRPRRWARVRGRTPSGDAGWAHADERGEFVLPVLDAGHDLTRDTRPQIIVTLRVFAPRTLPDPLPPTADRTADLVSEPVSRPANPPAAADLDNPELRGEAVPAGYVADSRPDTDVHVDVGAPARLGTALDFVPQP